ncbi:MAG: PHP domain-containing protein [Thermoleophilaceae bacterium]
MIELQSHSTVSDGELEPAGVVEAAAAAGVTTLSLSDHDAIDGLEAASEAAKAAGIELVPAVEMSCGHPVAEELHMLGYWIDLDTIAAACKRAQAERVARAEEIIANLNQAGVEVTLEGAIEQAGDAASVGRPHIAKAAGVTDMGPFFEKYLIPGTPTFVPRRWPSTPEAVDLIHGAGGAAVLAHPFWDLDEPQTVADLIDELDLDGVEVFYPSHTHEQTEFLVGLCRDRGLALTASSDFHGPDHKMFSRFGAYDTYGLAQPEVPARPS